MAITVDEKVYKTYKEYKAKYKGYVVFVLDGKFYRTFDDDALIMWYLFKYKVKENFVGFPKTVVNKIIDELELKCVNYYIIDSETYSNIKESNNAYSKILVLAKYSYNKLKDIDILSNKIEKLLLNDISNFNKINNFLDKL